MSHPNTPGSREDFGVMILALAMTIMAGEGTDVRMATFAYLVSRQAHQEEPVAEELMGYLDSHNGDPNGERRHGIWLDCINQVEQIMRQPDPIPALRRLCDL